MTHVLHSKKNIFGTCLVGGNNLSHSKKKKMKEIKGLDCVELFTRFFVLKSIKLSIISNEKYLSILDVNKYGQWQLRCERSVLSFLFDESCEIEGGIYIISP